MKRNKNLLVYKFLLLLSDGMLTFATEYYPDDRLAELCRIELDTSLSEACDSPALYQITWRRVGKDGVQGQWSTSTMSLPSLLAPQSTDIVAVLHTPSKLHLHQPATMLLTLRNPASSGRTANIMVSLEPSEQYVASGLKGGRVGIIPPGEDTEIRWRIVPMECGWIGPPIVRLMDVREDEVEDGKGKPIAVHPEVEKILVLP